MLINNYILKPSEVGTLVAAIDCGRTSGGTVGIWQEEGSFLTGNSGSNVHDYGGTPNTNGFSVTPEVLRKVRFNNAVGFFRYTIPVISGSQVRVELFFYTAAVETNYFFDIVIEGTIVADNYNIQSEFAAGLGGMKSFTVTENGDGNLLVMISFQFGGTQSKLSGLKVFQL